VLAAAEEHRRALEEYTRGERGGGGWEGAWEALRGSVREIDVKLYAKLVASADRDASSARVCKRLKLHAPRGRAGARVGGADRGSGEEPLRGALSPIVDPVQKWSPLQIPPPCCSLDPSPAALHQVPALLHLWAARDRGSQRHQRAGRGPGACTIARAPGESPSMGARARRSTARLAARLSPDGSAARRRRREGRVLPGVVWGGRRADVAWRTSSVR
jgi:hypothetical protein